MLVKVYSLGEYEGSISLRNGQFELLPPSDLLRGILQEPVYVAAGDELHDVYAKDKPELFMASLYRHYKSYALSVTEVQGVGDNEIE